MKARPKSFEIFELNVAIQLVLRENYPYPIIFKLSSKNGGEEE